MLEAKTRLSRLVEAVERGEELEIIIARNGRPAARLVPMPPAKEYDVSRRIGFAKGKYVAPEPSDELDAEVRALFGLETPE
jgi:prevent-host-death family protein